MKQPANSPEVILAADYTPSETLPQALEYPASPSQPGSDLIHEIRSPLTSINLSIEMLESAITENDLKILLDIIKRNSARINNLVNEIIKYQRAGEAMPENNL